MVFSSNYPDLDIPTDLTVWEWALDSPRYSAVLRTPPHEIAGFTDGASKERVTHLELKEYATYISTALVRKYGCGAGDTVSLFSPNTVWYPVAMFAVVRIGGRVNGASPAYSVDEMAHALRTAETKILMTVPASLGVAEAACAQITTHKIDIVLLHGQDGRDGQNDKYSTLAELIELGRGYGDDGQEPVWRIPPGTSNKDACGFLTLSSGTTGLPKAVMLSHHNVIAQNMQVQAVSEPGKRRFLAQSPLFHISSLVRLLNWPVLANHECVVLPAFSMERFLNAIVEFQIEELNLVPPLVIRLVRDPIVDKYDLSCVQRISCSSAPLSKEILQLLASKFPWTGFRQGYGMTETCGAITTHPPAYYSYRYGTSSGLIVPNTEIRIVSLNDPTVDLDAGAAGEIWCRGPQIAMGYLNNADATAETFASHGFIRTGDVGYIDKHGLVYIVDRIKEMIKVKGTQVAPVEIEDVLHGHPSVADCAVLGIPDDYSGERPKAHVVLKDGIAPSHALGQELIDYIKARRARYKWVKEIEFASAIPRNPSGKILRRQLKDREKDKGTNGNVIVKDGAGIAGAKL